jgi:hypothetical protein
MSDTTGNNLQEPDISLLQNSAPAPASDSMSSLRAAALLSLKAKRKTKPADGADATASQSKHPHPVPTVASGPDAMQLDYGGPEDTAANTAAAPVLPAEVPKPQTPSDVEEGQIREEGEISDSENTPTVDQPPLLATTLPSARPGRPAVSVDTTANLFSIGASSAGDNSSTAPTMLPSGASSQAPFYGLDANHVRPGLASTWLLLCLS